MRRNRALAPVLLLVTLCGCVSLGRTPEPRFFVLRALAAAPPAPAVTGDGDDRLVAVLGVRIPDHLERPQLVLWTAPNELRIDEFLRWAEPLDAGVTRTLADDIAGLLPRYRVLRAPWPAAAQPRCRIATELRVFGPQPDGRVTIEGTFALLAGGEERALVRRAFSFSRGPVAGAAGVGGSGAAPAAEPGRAVEAMSELLVDVAKEIAAAVEALPPDASTTRPASSGLGAR